MVEGRHGFGECQATVKYPIRDRDSKFPVLFDEALADAGIAVVLTEIRMPRMNAVMERWVPTPDAAPATPLRPAPEPITQQARILHLDVRRRDCLGGILHEYEHAA
ncbi:MAG TPA: hypothetical protein VGS97_21230 [Actinocrinis sp.]|uniref:hypothetical protein n=1 Tax=Actinocrinis sp. TaxID=1920516 RepID=UPI002DDD6031|nr:hypothetical protein [Actinocrinis sp.]HEV2346637.1 hypothetical protein [Actinocrinis sp.]